jgi:peptidoglycan/xylan/chitin deacetylase (PgdA/CDA1 family)
VRAIKRLIKRAVTSGAGWRATSGLRSPGIVVLMYHRIGRLGGPFPALDVSVFREQMQWLKRRCAPIFPEEFREKLPVAGRARPYVLVTFDDGYRDYNDNAYPILQELRIPAVVFLATSFMDNGGVLWTDVIHYTAHRSTVSKARLPWDESAEFDLRRHEERNRWVRRCKEFLKDVPDGERRRRMAEIVAQLGVDPDGADTERQMLNWDEVRATTEWTRYGGHTHTHPILSQLTFDEADREIRLCRDRIEVETGVAPKYFAYPNGRAADFSDETKRALVRNGFELAFSTVEGVNGDGTDLLAIRRLPTGAPTTADFAWLVSGHGA